MPGGLSGGGQAFSGAAQNAGSSVPRLDQLARHALPVDELQFIRQNVPLPSNLIDRRLIEMPNRVMQNIIGYLPGSDLISLSQTSSDMRQLVRANTRPLNLPPLRAAPQEANIFHVRDLHRTWHGYTQGVLPEQLTQAGHSPWRETGRGLLTPPGQLTSRLETEVHLMHRRFLSQKNAAAELREWELSLRSIRLD